MEKTNFGVIDKITHPLKLYGPILLADVGLIIGFFTLASTVPALFANATSPAYYWSFVIAMGGLFLYLRLPSGSNPHKSNFKMLIRDVLFKHNQFYQSDDYCPDEVVPLKINIQTKKQLDRKL